MQPLHDDIPYPMWDESTWKHMHRSMQERYSNDETECDCLSSDPEVPIRKSIAPSLPKRPQMVAGSRRRDKPVKVTRSRRKLYTSNVKKSTDTPRDPVYSSLCDQPRRVKRTHIKQDTTRRPDLIQVKSVEVIKSWSKDRCSANYSSPPRGRITKDTPRNPVRKPKFINPQVLESSGSSALSARGAEKCCQCPESFSPEETYNYQVSRKTRQTNSGQEICYCCECLKETAKSIKTQTYSNTRHKARSPERIYKSQESPVDEFQREREQVHKVRGRQAERNSPESQKLCRMLKTREARRIIGCCCIEEDSKGECPTNCQCPESPFNPNVKTSPENVNKFHQQEPKRPDITYNSSEICVSELNTSILCSCEPAQLNSHFKNVTSDAASLKDLHQDILSSEDWRKCNEHLEKMSKDYQTLSSRLGELRKEAERNRKSERAVQRRITRQYTSGPTLQKERRDASTCCPMRETLDQDCRCDGQSEVIETEVEKFSEIPVKSDNDHDPVEAVASLCEKWKTINRVMDPGNRVRATRITCRPVYCQCMPHVVKAKHRLGAEFTSFENNVVTGGKRRSKQRVKRHKFALPKVVKPEDRSGNLNIPKMFVYPPEGEQGSPLAVYKTSSFVNCSIKQKENAGYKYYITYVQKYVSPMWKPDENIEDEIKDTGYLSSDDYG